MGVPMVGVRVVGVRMLDRRMLMPVRMGFSGSQRQTGLVRVIVQVVRVVRMRMLVLHRPMGVEMPMPLGQMQPNPQAHQEAGGNEFPCDRFPTGQGQSGTEKRRH